MQSRSQFRTFALSFLAATGDGPSVFWQRPLRGMC